MGEPRGLGRGVESYNALQRCVYFDAECVAAWAAPELGKGRSMCMWSTWSTRHALLVGRQGQHRFHVVHATDEGLVALLNGIAVMTPTP